MARRVSGVLSSREIRQRALPKVQHRVRKIWVCCSIKGKSDVLSDFLSGLLLTLPHADKYVNSGSWQHQKSKSYIYHSNEAWIHSRQRILRTPPRTLRQETALRDFHYLRDSPPMWCPYSNHNRSVYPACRRTSLSSSRSLLSLHTLPVFSL